VRERDTDIDVLCEDCRNAAWILHARKVYPHLPYRPHYEIDVAGSLVRLDLRYIGDGYYCEAWERWEDKVTDVGSRRRFFVDDPDNAVNKTPFVIAMTICCVVAGASGIAMAFFLDFILEGILAIFLSIGAGMLCGWIVGTCEEMSKEAIELQAQTKALRRWLLDFTRLKEAVPHDVILWNRLLVMATSLGVADKVVKNLKVAYPEMFNNPDVWPMYWWYYDYGRGRAPYSMMSDTMQSAHHVSSSALASSSSSSGGGGGGGFSGGGGGGFGGGGGGGGF
jgi:uncharacterized membrane protein YgcG